MFLTGGLLPVCEATGSDSHLDAFLPPQSPTPGTDCEPTMLRATVRVRVSALIRHELDARPITITIYLI
jgi:hypothetical protein